MIRPGTRQRTKLDVRTVREAARDRWQEILPALGVNGEALKRKHGPCPGCGGRDRFRCDDRDGAGTWICGQGGGEPVAGDGFALLKHVHGWTFFEALRAVAEVLGMVGLFTAEKTETVTGTATVRRNENSTTKSDARRREKAVARLRRAWAGSEPLDLRKHTPVRRYFEQRGLEGIINDPPSGMRFHPALGYWITDDSGKLQKLDEYPTLLSVVTGPDGLPVTLHRLYLNSYGSKARVPCPRKMMTPAVANGLTGSAIRLFPCTGTLVVGEGLETALAGRVLNPSQPVWSTINDAGMSSLLIPPSVRQVLILVDHDKTGLTTARALAVRLLAEGHHVHVAVPPASGMDWLDVIESFSIRRAA